MMRLLLVAWVVTALSSSGARAQEACEEGRERISGRCCWPGQTWSEERGRCEGAPSCPDTLVEHGDACVAPAVVVTTSVPAPTGYGPTLASWLPPGTAASTEGWPLAEGGEDAPTHRAMTGRGEDEVHVAISFATFDVGWVMGWIGVMVDEGIRGCSSSSGSPFGGFGERRSCNSWGFAFIPLVGGLVSSVVGIDARRDNYVSMGHGITSLVLQFVGLIAIPASLANDTTEITFQPLDVGHGVTATLELSAPGADSGAGVRVTW